MVNRPLRFITGWAHLIGAAGIFIDVWASWSLNSDSPEWLVSIVAPSGLGEGSIGLIPTYLGGNVGITGLVIVLYRTTGVWTGLLCGIGVLGMFTFWGSYPARATFVALAASSSELSSSLPGWGRVHRRFGWREES
jgi:hypothetical protein